MGAKPLSLLGVLLLLVTAACATASIPGQDEVGGGRAAQTDPTAGDDNNAGADLKCSGTQTKCGNECVDVKTSANHCGACGSPCASGTTCNNGFCSSEGSCAADRLACGSKCVDAQTDNDNCGACGHTCGDGGTCTKGGCPGELRVRALIDGTSQLTIAGANISWHVVRAAAPGRWNGHNDPTILNGSPWLPVWPSAGENRDCNCDSQLFPSVPAPLKGIDQLVTIKKVEGRGSVSIAQQPSAANNYTLKVDFTDGSSGAAWYEIVLGYTSN